jgi:hypothetical protein
VIQLHSGNLPIALKVFLRKAVPQNDPIPRAVTAVQTFGDFLGVNP